MELSLDEATLLAFRAGLDEEALSAIARTTTARNPKEEQ